MKVKALGSLIIIVMLIAIMVPGAAFAQAYASAFTTSITYQNVGSAATTQLKIAFYDSPTDTTPTEITRTNLNPGAGTSLFIGGLDTNVVANGFRGAAVMTADQPLLATLVQLPQGTGNPVKNRPLSNGFSEGAPQSLIATVLKNMYDSNTIFSVQNVGTAQTTATVRFYNTSAAEVHTVTQALEPGGAFYLDAGTEAGLGASFNGSAVVETTGGTGSIVGTAMELDITGIGAKAFEGVGSGATTFYMPSALCNYGTPATNTSYAVQNTSLTTATDVTVTYSNGNSQTQNIGPGAKKSFVACAAVGMPSNFIGAATITSTATPVIAIGKAYGAGLSTAFVGASAGSAKVALPYVRWASDANWAAGTQQRVNLTIQNIGSADLAAGAVVVKYIDRDGNVVGTHTLGAIAAKAKVNSNAAAGGLTEFGVYAGGTQFGGGAIVEGPAGAQLAVVARVSTQTAANTYASEDYNGMAAP